MLRFYLIGILVIIASQRAQAQDSIFSDLKTALDNPRAVLELRLNSQKITEFPDSILALFPNLKKVDLSHNKISKFSSIGQIAESLNYLDLSSNDLNELPLDLGRFSQLKYLNLSFNQITNLPYSIYELESLEFLNLAGNSILFLNEDIGHLRKLKVLDIRGKQLYGFTKPELQLLFKQEVKIKKSPGCNC